ncbi:uncharacterized protein PHACADRAFT_212289 [Phanerochaete carnosa HHB-10118-sp]|uniref:F-box domain-containing protein n=1 Tax=Phanerochaete carnosa (strain HHB-10118-sp) TaxID=650164 RepID=K5VJW5_PHACS|nr:uncharacterized protein PHACADRAFT_212289 [Phanerochaete carnosa HHB-10118-sp]EKM51658.1 hypothetical protein PHACADRAFT_212289 [Phanerochaete carnosa HHB-10118-sp]
MQAEGLESTLAPGGSWPLERLPEELLREVLDHLHSDSDKTTLKACSQACHRWCTYVTPSLFRRLSWPPCYFAWEDAFLQVPWTEECSCREKAAFGTLATLLSSSPRVRQAVRELRFRARCKVDLTLTMKTLHAIVEHLPRLDILELSDLWVATIPAVAAWRPARGKSLGEVRLAGDSRSTDVAPQVLKLFDCVGKLVMASFDAAAGCTSFRDDGQSAAVRVPALVVDFEEDGYAGWLDAPGGGMREFCSYLDAPSLRDLVLCHPFAPHMEPLTISWPALSSLSYVLGKHTPTLSQEASHSLESLTLGIRLPSKARNVQEWVKLSWDWMLRDLEALPAANINELGIVFLTAYFLEVQFADGFDMSLQSRDWGALERVILRRFPQIRAIYVQVGSHTRGRKGQIAERCDEVVKRVTRTRFTSRLSQFLDGGGGAQNFASVHHQYDTEYLT